MDRARPRGPTRRAYTGLRTWTAPTGGARSVRAHGGRPGQALSGDEKRGAEEWGAAPLPTVFPYAGRPQRCVSQRRGFRCDTQPAGIAGSAGSAGPLTLCAGVGLVRSGAPAAPARGPSRARSGCARGRGSAAIGGGFRPPPARGWCAASSVRGDEPQHAHAEEGGCPPRLRVAAVAPHSHDGTMLCQANHGARPNSAWSRRKRRQKKGNKE